MTALVCLLLIATPTAVKFVDQIYQIPAGDWRFVALDGLKRRAGQVRADIEVRAGQPVRLILMERADLERLNRGEPAGQIQATSPERSARLKAEIERPGDYVMVVDNRQNSAEAASVHLRIWLDYGGVTQLPLERQLTVVAISFTVFFGIVTFSARRLWRAVRS
jgi:hypothetical protein